ncbi:MAG: GFA family protein [Hyphomicrobiaceae bacterium]
MSAKKPDPKLKSGGCLCGAVRFQAQLNGLHYHVCHCERCRKWGGGPAFGAPASSVKYEEVAGLALFSSSSHGQRYFCKQCGTQLLWQMKSGQTSVIWVGALDEGDDLKFENELFIDSKPTHYSFANETQKLTGAEMKALYAARGA